MKRSTIRVVPLRRYDAIGAIGGAFSGLLGIGGGTVMVPLLVLCADRLQRDAHAMSLAAIIPISASAVATYGGAGAVSVPHAIALTAGTVIGAQIGASVLARAPERPLKAAFGSFLIFAAVAIAIG
jgi:uncharacterized membrane protein YfcA